MILLCVGATVAGLLASIFLPFLPMAFTLLLAMVLGIALRVLDGDSLGQTLLFGVILLVMTQLGYGAGLLASVALRTMSHMSARVRPLKQDAVPSNALHPRTGRDKG